MIIKLNSELRPMAQILNINLQQGQVDFRWLDANGNPSPVYNGVCMTVFDKEKIGGIPTETEIAEAIEKEAGGI